MTAVVILGIVATYAGCAGALVGRLPHKLHKRDPGHRCVDPSDWCICQEGRWGEEDRYIAALLWPVVAPYLAGARVSRLIAGAPQLQLPRAEVRKR